MSKEVIRWCPSCSVKTGKTERMYRLHWRFGDQGVSRSWRPVGWMCPRCHIFVSDFND